MSDKKPYKMTDNELREGSFRPRVWSNHGYPIDKHELKKAMKDAEQKDYLRGLSDLEVPMEEESEEDSVQEELSA